MQGVNTGVRGGNNMYRLLLTVEKLDTPRPKTQELMDFLDGNAFKFLDRSGSSRDLYKDCKNKD